MFNIENNSIFVHKSECFIFYVFIYNFFLQFDEPSEDLTEFVAEEEAGFKGESSFLCV